MGWQRVLVLTFQARRGHRLARRPSQSRRLRRLAVRRQEHSDDERDAAADYEGPVVWFASLQDLGGRDADGNIKEARNEVIHLVDWDAIVLDEYHFGAWRDSARALYDSVDKGVPRPRPDDQVTADEIDEELAARRSLLEPIGHLSVPSPRVSSPRTRSSTGPTSTNSARGDWEPGAGPNPTCRCRRCRCTPTTWVPARPEYAEDGEFAGFSLNETFKATKGPGGLQL